MQKYVELRNRQTFGDLINTYFIFLKTNIKSFLNQYFRYNFIGFLLMLSCAYLLIHGFMGLSSRSYKFGVSQTDNYETYLYLGLAVFIIAYLVTFILNSSLSSAYVTQYVETKNNINQKGIWEKIKANIGSVILLMLIGIGIFIGYLIVSTILAFIPIIGMFAQYGINFVVSAIFGFSFIGIFDNNQGIGKALSTAWDFTIKNFFFIIGYGLVVGILNFVITTLVLMIPGIILGVYGFFAIDSGTELYESVTANVIFTLFLCIFLIIYTFLQALSQLAYGVLYYNMHEKQYNIFLQSKIELIGQEQ